MTTLKEIIKDSKLTDKRSDLFSILFLCVLCLSFMWRIVFANKVLLPLDSLYQAEPWHSESDFSSPIPIWNSDITDAIWQFYPMAHAAKNLWRDGIPLWDQNVLSGMPALARGEMFSNPIFNLLALVLSVAKAISWSAVFHLLVASISLYLFVREIGVGWFGSLVASISFTYNGYLVGWLSFPPLISSMAWLPLIFFAVERSLRKRNWHWLFIGAFAFTFQILSGSILWPFYSVVTLFLFFTFKSIYEWYKNRTTILMALKPIFYAILSIAIGVLLSAPQLLLTAQLYFQTGRTEALGVSSYLKFTNHLLRLFVPNIYGNPLHGGQYLGPFNYTETDLYFGLLPMVFLVVTIFLPFKKVYAWGFGGIGFITFLAVYNVFPFRQIVSNVYVIFLNAFPGRIFFIVAFSWAVVAGINADWLANENPKHVLQKLWLVPLLAVIGLSILSILVHYDISLFKFHLTKLDEKSIRLPIFNFLLITALFCTWGFTQIDRRIIKFIALIFLTCDLFAYGVNYNPAFAESLLYPKTPSLNYLSNLLAKEKDPTRVININSGFLVPGMVPEFFSIPTISGYSSWILKRYSEYVSLSKDKAQFTINHVYFSDCCDLLVDALNVKYVYSMASLLPESSGSLNLLSNLDQSKIETVSPDHVHLDTWNLNNITRPVIYAHPPSRISYELDVNNSTIFKTAIGMDPKSWELQTDGVLFEILGKGKGDKNEILLFSRYIDPVNVPNDRAWIDVRVDLSQFAGDHITLTLETLPGPDSNYSSDWSGWGEPRLENYFPANLKLIYDGPNKIYENTKSLPRAWVVHDIISVDINDIEAIKKYLTSPNFDPSLQAIIEGYFPINEATENINTDKVDIRLNSPGRMEIEASLHESGLLVLSDTMYPGWEAEVDGNKTAIYYTNLFMRGVYLSEGEHLIVYSFRPKLLVLGVAITGVTLILIVFLFSGILEIIVNKFFISKK